MAAKWSSCITTIQPLRIADPSDTVALVEHPIGIFSVKKFWFYDEKCVFYNIINLLYWKIIYFLKYENHFLFLLFRIFDLVSPHELKYTILSLSSYFRVCVF